MEEKYEAVLAKHYDLIHVEEDEQFTLGVNVLSIGNGKVISLPINKNTNKELKKRGYEIIEVDITEIIKSGGSFRCCSMPIVRK
jgi:N-dimethylarginine dimethylaminohydrolase